ncbi:hypothetical protein HaLaN_03771 [Haematococcus lacustris]|uniref:Uncharacterized protein n=1 Tax=Haematococcus lacustris TaxID=44745 RepID=A0A699YFC9_HAELA|nr:hypothetical protein HaLaN_03771 [Haematococcus lacustris]
MSTAPAGSAQQATRPADWKPPAGQVHHRPVRPAWSQQRDQPGPALPCRPSAASAPRLSRQLSPQRARARVPRQSQHHSRAGGWTGTAMQR